MQLADNLDPDFVPYRRLRLILQCGIGIMVLFSMLSLSNLLNQAGLREVLSFICDSVFTLGLIGLLVFQKRLQLSTIALSIAGALLLYAMANIILSPGELIRLIAHPLLAVIVAVAYVDSRQLRIISVSAWLAMIVLFLRSDLAGQSPAPAIDLIALAAAAAIAFLLLNQFHSHMTATLLATKQANQQLRDAQANLEQQVSERTISLQQALENVEQYAIEQAFLLSKTEQQQSDIRSLSLPILPINQTTLVAPLIGMFDTHRLLELQQQTLEAIQQTQAKTLVLDITGVLAVDHEVAAGLISVADAVRLMGARIVLVGIRPEVAQSLVSLGVSLAGLHTAATLQEGIAAAQR